MGVLSLYTILAGGAWLTKEYILEASEREDDNIRGRAVENYVTEHTDPKIEAQMWEYVATAPDDKIWERIETFKRDNPVYCARLIKKYPWKKTGYCNGMPVTTTNAISWERVGNERCKFYAEKNTKTAHAIVANNRKYAVCYLMQTYGKMATFLARRRAEQLYPMKKSKRSW